jgi:hypothetical protein
MATYATDDNEAERDARCNKAACGPGLAPWRHEEWLIECCGRHADPRGQSPFFSELAAGVVANTFISYFISDPTIYCT